MGSLLKATDRRFRLGSYNTVSRFRSARGKVLRRLIDALALHLGRDIRILDVGGRPDYWLNVGFGRISHIEISNLSATELDYISEEVPPDIFESKVGDARNLADYPDASIDLVHSNSVIEHVGAWEDMAAMASELLRVGQAGWVQTPAWSFPLEPHFRVPVAHWFGRPFQARMMSVSFMERFRSMDPVERRRHVERINLLTRRDVEALFPGRPIHVERVALFPKSYSAYWLPEGITTRIE